jgi:hypothetical protein
MKTEPIHTCVEKGFKLVYVRDRTRQPVYALDTEAEEIDSLNTLIHNLGNCQAIALIQSGQRNAEDGSRWGHLRVSRRGLAAPLSGIRGQTGGICRVLL